VTSDEIEAASRWQCGICIYSSGVRPRILRSLVDTIGAQVALIVGCWRLCVRLRKPNRDADRVAANSGFGRPRKFFHSTLRGRQASVIDL
jgi:hypothetical protein